MTDLILGPLAEEACLLAVGDTVWQHPPVVQFSTAVGCT